VAVCRDGYLQIAMTTFSSQFCRTGATQLMLYSRLTNVTLISTDQFITNLAMSTK